MNQLFYPGKPWLDTNGNRIQAHGGSIIEADGHYYWYGENKEKSDGLNGIWHWGVRCYRSDDLYNWEDQGIIIAPELKDETSPMYFKNQMDRPHIIYNRFTKKYVCWIKVMHPDDTQTSSVYTSDSILGPYTLANEDIHPVGMSAGDFDLAVADDGKAYYYFERVHSETICADLTADYLDFTGYYSTHFPHLYPPYVREATAHFIRKHKHYLLTSGTTGYFPNPTEVAIADTWHGPYEVLGNPSPDDSSETSYHSQVTSVFKVPNKKDLYIVLADRWLPNEMHRKYSEYALEYESYFNPEVKLPEGTNLDDMVIANTSIADYVWLPLRFDGDMAYIDWHESWSLDDYE